MNDKIGKMWVFIDALFGGVFRFMDRHSITRRVALYISFWVTIDSYVWVKHFIDTATNKTGAEVALITGALLAAVTALQGWMFKLYLEDKTNKETG